MREPKSTTRNAREQDGEAVGVAAVVVDERLQLVLAHAQRANVLDAGARAHHEDKVAGRRRAAAHQERAGRLPAQRRVGRLYPTHRETEYGG